MKVALYLIPVTLGDSPIDLVIPSHNRYVIQNIRHFIVENERSARRFIKKIDPAIEIDDLQFYILNKHTSPEVLAAFLSPIFKGEPVGLLSEAGCPAIADPGADIVAIGQKMNVQIVPLVGPSSILLSLMASGFNGQNFAFRGYLPIEAEQRIKTLKKIEQSIYNQDQTQIFIETPYRNSKLVDDILKNCRPTTKLCLAADITCDNEFIKTLTIQEWSKKVPKLEKRPCIFLLYK
ncbi:S-adenosylmethionine-dependent methyltransferase [Bacteroidales bacterium]|nr:S-adenosylmethionine-dependent methyltransferase [Bacteroidales bacterium]